jgi:Fur family transcriptional regulator, ferric uptake regulator
MCRHCDYKELLKASGLESNSNRIRVMEIVGNSSYPLSAQEIRDTIDRTASINRVTVYRILYLLVEKGLLDRISSGDRSFRYGMAPNAHHRHHPHFYCKQCSTMECLSPESVHLDTAFLERTFPGAIEKVEVRLDGICKNCLQKLSK